MVCQLMHLHFDLMTIIRQLLGASNNVANVVSAQQLHDLAKVHVVFLYLTENK